MSADGFSFEGRDVTAYELAAEFGWNEAKIQTALESGVQSVKALRAYCEPNLQQRIREWMAAQDGPRTSKDVALGIGNDYIKTQWAVSVMLRAGMVVRTKDTRPMLYALGRPVLTPEEISAAAHAGRAGYYARRRGEAAERKERLREASVRRAAERQEARRLAQAVLNAQRKREALEQREAALEQKLGLMSKRKSLVRQAAIPGQSVEEWLANGGKVQRLGPGEGSKFQLQFIGHRGANDATWRQREFA